MRHFSATFMILLTGLFAVWPTLYGSDSVHLPPGDLLPEAEEISGWQPVSEPEFATGNELYVLIDGGAVIYQEYGFRSAVFQTYHSVDAHAINLEIYEMEDSDAAYGMYSFRRGINSTPFDAGEEGSFETYYLNFWEGHYLITIVGLDTSYTTLEGIKALSAYIDKKLDIPSNRPFICSLLPGDGLKPNGITYFRGQIGLNNQYFFDYQNIFGVTEGVMGRYNDHSILLFQYDTVEQALNNYQNARQYLQESRRFSGFCEQDNHFCLNDTDSSFITIQPFRYWIMIALSDEREAAPSKLKNLEKKLIMHFRSETE